MQRASENQASTWNQTALSDQIIDIGIEVLDLVSYAAVWLESSTTMVTWWWFVPIFQYNIYTYILLYWREKGFSRRSLRRRAKRRLFSDYLKYLNLNILRTQNSNRKDHPASNCTSCDIKRWCCLSNYLLFIWNWQPTQERSASERGEAVIGLFVPTPGSGWPKHQYLCPKKKKRMQLYVEWLFREKT